MTTFVGEWSLPEMGEEYVVVLHTMNGDGSAKNLRIQIFGFLRY